MDVMAHSVIKTKFKAGKYLIPVTMTFKNHRIIMQFQYNKILIEEMKAFDGAKWDPDGRFWHIPDSQRNRFQLDYLMGKNPYARYDTPLAEVQSNRPLYSHQKEMVAFGLARHYCIFAAEMGCLHGDTMIQNHPIKYWYNLGKIPLIKSYNRDGKIMNATASRIIRKKQKIVHIQIGDLMLRVGSQHLFLALKDGKPCHVRATNLTPEHSLVTDKSLGTMITSIQLTQNKKHIGLASGMAMVQSMNKMVITEVNSRLKKLKQSNNSQEILSVLKYQIVGRLSYLESNGWICPVNPKDNTRSLRKNSDDILLEDCLTLTDLSQYTVVDELETFMQLYATLQEVCYALLQIILKAELSQGMEHIKYPSMAGTEYKNWHTIFIKMQQGILNTKQIDFEKPTKFLVAKESEHLIPSSFQHLGALSLKNAAIIMEPATWVYDLTVPIYGNYFDDNGINHQNTGKTLAAIEIMESLGVRGDEAWYVGPKSGVRAVDLELLKWQSKVYPRMMTYEQLTKEMKNWQDGKKAPRLVIFDESSKIKTPTAQRSLAALALADGVRSDWGDQGYVILMSGTPAPKSPVDWWHQCLADDTWVTTTQGLRQIKDLINVPFEATVQGRVAHSNGFFKTGTKQLYKVTTKQGYMIRCTKEEKFLIDYAGLQMFKSLSELSIGDSLIISDCGNQEWAGYGDYKDGYLIGQLIGDGYISKDLAILQFYSPDFCIIPFIKTLHTTLKFSRTKVSYRVTSKYLNNLIRQLGLTTDKFLYTAILKKVSSNFLKGLVSGIFDTDGSVHRRQLKLEIIQSKYDLIKKLQLILNSLGIKSTTDSINNKEPKIINGRNLNTQDTHYRLTITTEDAIKFYEKIQINHPEKYSTFLTRLSKPRNIQQGAKIAEIVSIEKDIVEDVYDCEVEDIHMFTANGLVVHNCEVACPGFMKEGNIHKFRNRLAIVEERENMLTGGKYPHLIGWRDSENRCECGMMKEDPCHSTEALMANEGHIFKAAKNEVALLYERMKGLVLVKFKKDCLDLPEKQYRLVYIKPAPDLLMLAKHIKKVQSRAITVLTLLRELSDGFQYKEIETGEFMECPRCHGTLKVMIPVPREAIDTTAPTKEVNEAQFDMQEMTCDHCSGVGQVPTYTRSQDEVPCPKDEQLKEDLEDHEDIGRLIVWGGFTGTIDRIVKICQSEGWSVLRVDGRGYCAMDTEGKSLDDRECLMAMDGSHPRRQELLNKYPKLCFVGHPKAGGMALTLTASPTEIFFSNDFSGEGRMQAEDRFHRPGMDINRGATIVDYIHLPSDQYVLENLKRKKDLQKLSLGDLDDIFKSIEKEEKDAGGKDVTSSDRQS